jgi:epoxyqueuosine reductase QueG
VDPVGAVEAWATEGLPSEPQPPSPEILDSEWLREVCLEAGADDVGFASLSAPGLKDERPFVLEALPGTRTVISYLWRFSRDNIRSRATSMGNADIGIGIPDLAKIGHRICLALQDRGVRAVYPSAAFPMEVHRIPSRGWVISYKTAAVAAGLGHMGIHRNLIHPRFGSQVALGAVLTQAAVTEYSAPLDWNPCVGCNLCIAACPVGAIRTDDSFDFGACYNHNYSQFLTSFATWAENLAESKDSRDYRQRFTQSETVQMWQSLAFKPQYRSGYCLAVCPAGEDVIGPFLNDRKEYVRDVLRPFQQKPEVVYVAEGSNAEHHVRKRFPHKTARHITNAFRSPDSVDPAPAPDPSDG